MRVKDKLKLEKSKIILIVLGIAMGVFLGFAPEPLLHALLYRDTSSMTWVFSIVSAMMLIILVLEEKRPFGITRKQAYRMFSIGISGTSFFLALLTFLRYPEILASNDYGWAVRSNWNIAGITDSIGALIFFSASVLWETLIGSLFGVLESWLKLE